MEIINLILFFLIPRSKRQYIVFSEGQHDWPFLKNILEDLVNDNKIPVYITSKKNEITTIRNFLPQVTIINIGEGYVRDLFFLLSSPRYFFITLTDLNCYRLKRSLFNKTEYIYIFHSIVSTHMIYREAAFDHYDTILTVGPHHELEIRAREKLVSLPKKKLIPYGYQKLFEIKQNALTVNSRTYSNIKKVLIAPTWGVNSITNLCLDPLIKNLLLSNFFVYFRPHPMSVKQNIDLINSIVDAYKENKNFLFDTNIASNNTLIDSDIMISDWSGAAFDYALALERPVLFIDVPAKVNNQNYMSIDLMPIEESYREIIGEVLSIDKINTVALIVNEILNKPHTFRDWQKIRSQLVYNSEIKLPLKEIYVV